jgi:hypothetical protein
MKRFVEGDTQIMVSTTVIEVGVDVPNATVMVIESAEKFGLSQLHQLRGRVGRGADKSYCILLSGSRLGNDARERIKILTATNNGFEIAETDLQLRGPGDIEGTQQSGIPFDLKIASLGRDGQIIEYVRHIAEGIVSEDPFLEKDENLILKAGIQRLFSQQKDVVVGRPEERAAGEAGEAREAHLGVDPIDVHVGDPIGDRVTAWTHPVVGGWVEPVLLAALAGDGVEADARMRHAVIHPDVVPLVGVDDARSARL